MRLVLALIAAAVMLAVAAPAFVRWAALDLCTEDPQACR